MNRQQKWFLRPFSWFVHLVSLFGQFFRTIVDALSGKRRYLRDLLLGAPALLAFLGVVTVTALGRTGQETSARQYWIEGNRLFEQKEYEGAKLLLQKAAMGENVSRRDITFSLARSYEATGDMYSAGALMGTLASNGEAGYPPAHRYLAIRMAAQVSANKSAEDTKAWFWHLSQADQKESADLQKAWGVYFLFVGDLSQAAESFRNAAREEPALWLQVAELEARMNDLDAVRRTLATARNQLEQQFRRDPGNTENRLLYATALFYLGQLPDAERLLKEGLGEGDNESFRKLLAAIFVQMFDVELKGEGGVGKAFQYLNLSLSYDPQFQPALTRFVTLARANPESLEASREAMRRLIAEGNASAMAHFALGSLEWMAENGGLAETHMRQAIALDSKLVVVANNLAFLMAMEEKHYLEAALKFADQAVAAEPTNPDYLDTRASIYMKRGELTKAAVDYQKALERSRQPGAIRQQLAVIYDQLGDRETAEQFRKMASETGANSN
jgi:tetratricopeptide (TPR) repeat protein